MKQNRIAAAALALLLALLTAACGGPKEAADGSAGSSSVGSAEVSTSVDSADLSSGADASAGENDGDGAAVSSSAEASAPDSTAPQLTERQVRLNGQVLEIGMKLTESVLAAVGEPTDTQHAPSCHYDGDDTIYTYKGFSLYTFRQGGDDILYLVEITAAGIPLSTGAAVGMTLDQIKALYGSDYSELGQGIEYDRAEDFYLFFTAEGGTVTAMEIGMP